MSEHHVGTCMLHMYGSKIEKPVYCQSWRGGLYGKTKGRLHSTLYADGRWGDFHSWTDLILFDPWQRVADHRVMRVIHLVAATKERLGV